MYSVMRVFMKLYIIYKTIFINQFKIIMFDRPTHWQRFMSDKKAENEAVNNVLLYHNPLSRPRFFLIISIAAGIQLLFWTYLSYVALTEYYQVKPRANENIKDVNELVSSDNSLQNIIQSKAKSLKWRVGLSLFAMSVGTFFTFTALMYPLRTVHRILFYRGRQSVELTTYTPLGGLYKTEVGSHNFHNCTITGLIFRFQLPV